MFLGGGALYAMLRQTHHPGDCLYNHISHAQALVMKPPQRRFLVINGLPHDCNRREFGHVCRRLTGVIFMEVYPAIGRAVVRFKTERDAEAAGAALERYNFDATGKPPTRALVCAGDASPMYDPEDNWQIR